MIIVGCLFQRSPRIRNSFYLRIEFEHEMAEKYESDIIFKLVDDRVKYVDERLVVDDLRV